MAGVRFHDDPDLFPGRKRERVTSAKRQMDRELNAAIHACNNNCIPLEERQYATSRNISRAEADGR